MRSGWPLSIGFDRPSRAAPTAAIPAGQRVYAVGDIHGRRDLFEALVEAIEADDSSLPAADTTVILLGDLECQRPLHELVAPIHDITEVWWIPGNHDTDSADVYSNLFESELADKNLHGRVVEIAGIRVAGLGGIFRGEVWYPPDDPPQEPDPD